MTNTPTPPKLLDREPSEAMIEAGIDAINGGDPDWDYGQWAEDTWRAMFDAAPASPPHDGDVRERVARKLCELGGYKPDALEPGDDPHFDNTSFIDGQMPNGDPGHFRWRQFERNATTLLAILPSHSAAVEQAARVADAHADPVFGVLPTTQGHMGQRIAREIRKLASDGEDGGS